VSTEVYEMCSCAKQLRLFEEEVRILFDLLALRSLAGRKLEMAQVIMADSILSASTKRIRSVTKESRAQ
jgi:hypothetical protein